MGKFVKFQDKAGEFRFNLKADNGQVILTSEGYTTKSSRDNGIASVRKNCSDDSCFEKLESKNGKPYFNLRALNNKVIATSQMYADSSGMENGISSVKNNGSSTAEEEQ